MIARIDKEYENVRRLPVVSTCLKICESSSVSWRQMTSAKRECNLIARVLGRFTSEIQGQTSGHGSQVEPT